MIAEPEIFSGLTRVIKGENFMRYVLIALAVLVGAFAAYCLLIVISSLFVDKKREYGTNSRFYRFLLNSATAIGIHLLRIKVHKSGFENVPSVRFLVVSNHRSKFDPIVTWYALRKYDIAFISKVENFDVPVFGRVIRKCGFLSIDREHPMNAARTVAKAAEMMKNGIASIGVYPEGTRSKECVLLPFHNGIFSIAKKASAPVVVLAVRGTEKIHRQFIKKRTDVYLDVIRVLDASELEGKRTDDIGQSVRDTFVNFLEENGNA